MKSIFKDYLQSISKRKFLFTQILLIKIKLFTDQNMKLLPSRSAHSSACSHFGTPSQPSPFLALSCNQLLDWWVPPSYLPLLYYSLLGPVQTAENFGTLAIVASWHRTVQYRKNTSAPSGIISKLLNSTIYCYYWSTFLLFF